MAELQDILGQIPVDQIADMLGTDRHTAQAAVEAAVPTLLAGLHNNAQVPEGAASLESALGQHRDGLVDGGVDAAQVDTADGEKIVNHVFGGRQDQIANQLAGTAQLGGVGGDLVRKLLPLLAPIVMSYLANKVLGGRGQGGGGVGGGGQGGAGGIDLGGILGGILGGAGGAGGGLGDLLGGILDGGQQRNAGGGASAGTAGPESGSAPEPQPQAVAQGQRADGAPLPGELIDVDLPGQQQEEAPQDRPDDTRKNEGGLGGLLGGLFGKK